MAHFVLFSPVSVPFCFPVHNLMLSQAHWCDTAQPCSPRPSVIWEWTDLTAPELAEGDESHQPFSVMCVYVEDTGMFGVICIWTFHFSRS